MSNIKQALSNTYTTFIVIAAFIITMFFITRSCTPDPKKPKDTELINIQKENIELKKQLENARTQNEEITVEIQYLLKTLDKLKTIDSVKLAQYNKLKRDFDKLKSLKASEISEIMEKHYEEVNNTPDSNN